MNNNISKWLFVAILGIVGFCSCSNDGFYYKDTTRVRLKGPSIWALNTDSLTFSFVTTSATTTEIQFDIDACIIGKVVDYDRVVNLQVVADKTTASADMYVVPQTVMIPSNANHATFPVILKRVASLEDKEARLYIEIVPSSDFEVGVNEFNHFLLKWNDMLIQPTNWDSLKEFFGTYSQVKYRFMLNYSGVSEFDTETMSWAKLQNYKIKLTNALDEYNAEHPGNPLTDENGKLVSFNS